MNAKEKTTAIGIVAEYNPFHNGHKYHLEESMEQTGASVCVAAMSGNFMQRGEAAFIDKWTRAEAAVKNGVNLVVEIPTVYACANAGIYAKGAIEILENLGADYISFGSESGNIEKLKKIAREIKENEEQINSYIKDAVKSGMTYPKARSEAACKIFSDDYKEILSAPNNILALEYIKNITVSKPMTIERKGPGYNDRYEEGGFAAASYIRNLGFEENIDALVPEYTREIIKDKKNVSEETLFKMLSQKILMASEAELMAIAGGEEGLGNRAKKVIRRVRSVDELAMKLKSKRYTFTAVKRFLIHTLLGIKKEDMLNAGNYIRVLAFDTKGSAYLKEIKKSGRCKLPVITNVNKDFEGNEGLLETFGFDVKAADLYNMLCENDLYLLSEYVKKPCFVEKK